MYFTPTPTLLWPLYTHPALPSAIHRGFMMLQSGGLRLWGRGLKTLTTTVRLRGEERNWEIVVDGRIRTHHGSPRILLKGDFLKAKAQKWK